MRIILLLILLSQTAFAFEVDCYKDFSEAFAQGQSDIEINESFDAAGNLGSPSCDTIIDGKGNTICGKENGGITLRNGRSIDVKDVTMCEFTGVDGGVINNSSGCTVENLSGEFFNNVVENKGAVLSNSSSVGAVSGYFHDNAAGNNGGVIFSDPETSIDYIGGVFERNYANEGSGGTIFNAGNIGKIEADFIENWAKDNMGGVALCNTWDIESITGNFINNVSEQKDFGGGGAIFNSANINRLCGSFIGNESKNLGGAIHNMLGTINFISDENEILFSGNTDMTGSNAIYNMNGTINFLADKDITINDAISGSEDFEQSMNINPDGYSGNVIINNNVSNHNVNMYGGTLKFGENTQNDMQYFGNFAESVNFNFFGGTVDLIDSNLRNTNLGNLNLNSDMDLMLDIDFEKLLSDTISVNSFNSGGKHINIAGFNALTPAVEKYYRFSLVDGNSSDRGALLNALRYTGDDEMELPIYKYRVSYANGLLNFNRLDNEFNPAVLLSSVAAQLGGYISELNIYDSAFRNMDMYTLNERRDYVGICTSDKYLFNRVGNLWLRPYTLFENVPLRNAPKVSSIAYGSLFGAESEPIKMRRDWSMIAVPYTGYIGSNQTYDDVRINQNGGVLGALAMAYRKNFYTGLTANVGANNFEGNSMYGREDSAMIMSGIASKTGYNARIKNFYIQPNLFLAYTFVNAFDYKNAANVDINTKPLNVITISPGVKLFGNVERDFQPYVFARMFWNVIDKTRFEANGVELPQLSVKPFVMYGAGMRKVMRENFAGYFQVFVANGGRNGVGLMFGLRWCF